MPAIMIMPDENPLFVSESWVFTQTPIAQTDYSVYHVCCYPPFTRD